MPESGVFKEVAVHKSLICQLRLTSLYSRFPTMPFLNLYSTAYRHNVDSPFHNKCIRCWTNAGPASATLAHISPTSDWCMFGMNQTSAILSSMDISVDEECCDSMGSATANTLPSSIRSSGNVALTAPGWPAEDGGSHLMSCW